MLIYLTSANFRFFLVLKVNSSRVLEFCKTAQYPGCPPIPGFLFIRQGLKTSTQMPLINVPCTTQEFGYEWAENGT